MGYTEYWNIWKEHSGNGPYASEYKPYMWPLRLLLKHQRELVSFDGQQQGF